MLSNSEKLAQDWRDRFQSESSPLSETDREKVIQWLLGQDPSLLNGLSDEQLMQFQKGCDYRYRKFLNLYWNKPEREAYSCLINNLYRVSLIKNSLRNWLGAEKEASKILREVIQEVVQELVLSNQYVNKQNQWICTITDDSSLRYGLLFTDIEEYCLRPVNNQNILIGRIINHLKKQHKQGVSNIPKGVNINIVPDVIVNSEDDSSFNLVDTTAISQYIENKTYQEMAINRLRVKQDLEKYLLDKLKGNEGDKAIKWLNLYLKGYSAAHIENALGLPVCDLYRLREKVAYHANNFAQHEGWGTVGDWLEISLDKNFGLTESQWSIFRQSLTEQQKIILTLLQEGLTLSEIGEKLSLKKSLLKREWDEIYTKGRRLRS